MPTTPNTLYYGDKLDILRRYVKDDSIDLVYLDPPFNSNADYNVNFIPDRAPVLTCKFNAIGKVEQ